MPQEARELICMITRGTDHGVDLVRKRAADTTQVNPLDPLAKLINDFMARGGTIWACTPCVKSRGYSESDLVDGVVITGASVMHERIKASLPHLAFKLVVRIVRQRRTR